MQKANLSDRENFPLWSQKEWAAPHTWQPWVDTFLTQQIKDRYSPKASWKSRPFTEKDLHFFGKGVVELSELFTSERPSSLPDYFSHPKFRSAYLLYYLPLQAAKFYRIFEIYSAHLERWLFKVHTGTTPRTLRILDLGAGPGTATFAFTHWLLQQLKNPTRAELLKSVQFEFVWIDRNRKILLEGKELYLQWLREYFGESNPDFLANIKVETHAELRERKFDFVLAGNVLNEKLAKNWARILFELIEQNRGAGVLFLEPASRIGSQQLVRLREEALGLTPSYQQSMHAPESDFEEDTNTTPLSRTKIQHQSNDASERIVGPCLHAGACPLSGGRDWCHFSLPTALPGEWFKKFSKLLGSERDWLKFSYLWFASSELPAAGTQTGWSRIVSDPISTSRGVPKAGEGAYENLVCRPGQIDRLSTSFQNRLYRGEVVIQSATNSTKLGTIRREPNSDRPTPPHLKPRGARGLVVPTPKRPLGSKKGRS